MSEYPSLFDATVECYKALLEEHWDVLDKNDLLPMASSPDGDNNFIECILRKGITQEAVDIWCEWLGDFDEEYELSSWRLLFTKYNFVLPF